MEKKHQMEACSIKLSEINEAVIGPKRNKKQPWRIIPFFSYKAKKGANIKKEWMEAPMT